MEKGLGKPQGHYMYGNTYPPTGSNTRALQMQLHSAIQAAKGETEKRGINQKSIAPTIHRQVSGGGVALIIIVK